MARADDGRVMFVRHALPGERVVAEVTSEATSFVRADAVQVLEPSPDRVPPPCPLAGPGRCGGCDWQHVSLPGQRLPEGVARGRAAAPAGGRDREVEVEEVPGRARRSGLADPGPVRRGPDRTGRTPPAPITGHRAGGALSAGHSGGGRHGGRHGPVGRCPPCRGVRLPRRRAPGGGGGDGPSGRLADTPQVAAGLVVNGRTRRRPDRIRFEVGRAAVPSQLRGLLAGPPGRGLRPDPVRPGGTGATSGGPGRRPLRRRRPVHRSPGPGRRSAGVGRGGGAQRPGVRRRHAQRPGPVSGGADPVRRQSGRWWPAWAPRTWCVLDPARQGAGPAVMEALVSLGPRPRRHRLRVL